VAGMTDHDAATMPGLETLLRPVPVDGMHDAFRMPSMPTPAGNVFGGQVIGQAVIAAVQTVDADRTIHSFHAYFLRAGDASRPIVYRVERLRDGASFSARRVEAFQDEVPILSAIASFQSASSGPDHSEPPPAQVGAPESLPLLADQLRGATTTVERFWSAPHPFEVRISPWPLDDQTAIAAESAVWIRARQPLPDDPNLHRAAIAFASDYTLLQPIFRRHGIVRMGEGHRVASLDHAIWFHRPIRADEWMLFVQDSPNAIGARGLATGLLYDGQGHMAATVAQEGMIRRHRVPQTATPDTTVS
jgi:acyl-CoA thioesterase II